MKPTPRESGKRAWKMANPPKYPHGLKPRLGKPGYGGAKVTDDYIRCIRQAHSSGMPLKVIFEQFTKLKSAAIRSIVLRQSWKHVK